VNGHRFVPQSPKFRCTMVICQWNQFPGSVGLVGQLSIAALWPATGAVQMSLTLVAVANKENMIDLTYEENVGDPQTFITYRDRTVYSP
jgi:hypothetical protein